MNALEQELTDGFARIAQDAPHDLGLLSRVQARMSRRRRGRRYAAAFVAAAVVGVVAVAASVLPGPHKAALKYDKSPEAYFVAHTTDLTFPFTPTTLTPGAKMPPVVTVAEGGRLRLVWYPDGNGTQDDLDIAVSSAAMSEDPQHLSGGVEHQVVTVRGEQGLLACSDIYNCALSWHDAQGSFVRIVYLGSSLEQATARLLAVAEGLQVKPHATRLMLRVGLIPTGCTVKSVTQNRLELSGPAEQCHVWVGLPPSMRYSGRPVTYGGRHGVEALGDDKTQRQVFLTDAHLRGETISVAVPITWQRNLIDAFTKAIVVRG
jgi:hypothetical protein